MAGEGSKLAVTYSSYFQTLDVAAKARYNEKLAILGGIQDPYVTVNVIRSEEHIDWLNWPNIEYPDIYNYFVTTPSSYTKQQLKAYKSLDGYKYFVDGWVSESCHRLVRTSTQSESSLWESKTLSKAVCECSSTLGCAREGEFSHLRSLQLHGRLRRGMFPCRCSSFST